MRKFFKWMGIVLGSLVVLLLVLGGVMYFLGSSDINEVYDIQPTSLTIMSDSTTLARGRHLAEIHGCVDCHGEDLSGQVFVDAPPFRVTAANLTSGEGGLGRTYSAEDFDRAIRHGVKKDGHPVVIMPALAYHHMSDEDAAAIIAYIQHLPPVDNVLPPTEIRTIGKLMAASVFDMSMEVSTDPARSEPAPPAGPTEAYGEYLTSITCAYCHGSDLRGNPSPPNPDSPPAPDLAAAGQWPVDAFKHALRTGDRPTGDSLDVNFMPYRTTAKMHDYELEALHAYLATLGNGDT